MVPEFIKTSGYVMGSMILHGATILAIAFSPALMQIGSFDGIGKDAVTEPQSGESLEIVEINVSPSITQDSAPAPAPKVEPATSDNNIAENKDDFVVIKKEAPKKVVKVAPAKEEKVAAAKVETKLPEKKEEIPVQEDMSVTTIPKSEVLKELAVDETKEDAITDDRTDDQVEDETRMLEAVAAADAATETDQEIDSEIEEQLDATPSQEDIAAEMNTLPSATEEVANDKLVDANTEGAAMPEKVTTQSAAATGATAATALPQKGAEQGPEKSDGTKVAKQNFLQLRQQTGNQPPNYPERARMQRQEGSGQLKYFVTKDGRVTDLALTKSTGHPDLDVAAMNSFRKYRFVPGQEGYTVHNFRFALKGKELPARGRLRTTLTKPAAQ